MNLQRLSLTLIALLLCACERPAPPSPPASAAPAPAPAAAPEGTVELFEDRGELFVRAGTAKGLKRGASVAVVRVGEDGEPEEVGHASVLEVFENLSRVSLDAEALAAPAPRFAKLPVAPAPSARRAPAEQKRPPALEGYAEQSRGRIIVYNNSAQPWTGCEVRLPSNKRYLLGSLEARDSEGIALFRFNQDGIAYDRPNDRVAVRCREGQGDFKL